LRDGHVIDVRIGSGRVAAIGALDPLPCERLIYTGGSRLLPGVDDRHLHLAASDEPVRV